MRSLSDLTTSDGDESLQSVTCPRNVKIPIISCFGDIALAIGPAFEPYLDHAMAVLREAGAIQLNPVSLFSRPSRPLLISHSNADGLRLD